MARIHWEYREVTRTVIVKTGELGSLRPPQAVDPMPSTAPAVLALGRSALVKIAAPALAVAAVALSRGIAERRHRLTMRSVAALPPGRTPVIALPAGGDDGPQGTDHAEVT